MKTKMNCFYCSGQERDCSSYTVSLSENPNYCIWKQMAENDLKNHQRGEKDFILKEMLGEFLQETEEETAIMDMNDFSEILK